MYDNVCGSQSLQNHHVCPKILCVHGQVSARGVGKVGEGEGEGRVRGRMQNGAIFCNF